MVHRKMVKTYWRLCRNIKQIYLTPENENPYDGANTPRCSRIGSLPRVYLNEFQRVSNDSIYKHRQFSHDKKTNSTHDYLIWRQFEVTD